MDPFQFWNLTRYYKSGLLHSINKVIIFGEKGTEVIFSTKDGKVYGFGNNSFGELGFGHKNDIKEPQNIVELNDKQIIDFSYGFRHVLAKTKTGKLYSWGDNIGGQLGIGTKTSDYRPKLIDSLSDKCVIDMSCGYNHTLVLTEDRQLYGFGSNVYGQIGCGNTNNQLKPILINGFNNETVISISCGANYSLALTQTGDVYSWGYNGNGQLGSSNQENINIPTKIVVNNGLVFKQISGGCVHSLLLSECGDVYAFGYNRYGSLGNGNTSDSFVPIKVNALKNVKKIATQSWMKISMAKLKNNSYYFWGQCLNGNILKPELTHLKSFNDIMAFHSITKITVKPIVCYSKTNTFNDIIVNNISDKFNAKNFSDIVFKVGDKQIFVNKFILRVNSKYFRDKYSVKSTEIRELSSTESVDDIEYIEIINKYNYEVFYSYLKYLYTYSVEIENQYLDQLLILSIDHKEEDLIIECTKRIFSSVNNSIPFEKLLNLMIHSIDNNMNQLKAKCIDRIKRMTTIENICNVYELSSKYGLSELENNCLEFISGLKDKNIIIKTDSYKKMSKEMRLEFIEKLFNKLT